MSYVELRAHTAFSFGDGAVTPETLVRCAASSGYEAIALTDAADLGGLVRLACEARRLAEEPDLARRHVIRPIAGAELHVDGRPAAFLARDAEGYRNLAGLVTAARMGRWERWEKTEAGRRRGRPSLAWAQVAERAAGLHALTGPASGPLASLVRQDRLDEAERLLAAWREAFEGRLAVEVQLHHAGGDEAALAGALIALAERCGIPWVVAHDPRYVDDGSRLVHDVLTALRHGTTIDEAARQGVLHPNAEWRLLPPEEMRRRWAGREAGLEESRRIASECAFDLAWMRPPLPTYDVPPGHTDESFLAEQVWMGARRRWGEEPSERQERQIRHELEVIGRLRFAGFFLVMWDAIRFAQSRGILCQGRGSAANSAIAYCLGITAVDPVRHNLLFERFLSEVRVDGKAEAPDIDVDFEHDRREEVLDYMYARYARPHAAIACTIQTYRAPNAIQDAMRAFGHPPSLAVKISKRLHYAEPLEAVAAIRETYARQFGLDIESPRGRALLQAIGGFEGVPRLRSTHVGGFVLSAHPLGDHLPIEQTTMGRTIVQLDKDDLDAVGVPKFDFLGLGGLSLVRRAFDVIERRTGERPEIYRLPQDDPATYAMIAAGDTLGTFQIESRAQIASIVHTRPERLYDIVVQVALIRPGPIQARFVHPYTERRRGREPVRYYDERLRDTLEPILGRTQGIPIFQEQAMALAMALGGYTGGEADELRRTMGNVRKEARLRAALEKLRLRMHAALGARLGDAGTAEGVAQRIVDDLHSFSNYGFPESHAWSFALIAYATAWLKAHHPAAFYAGLLNSFPMGFYSPSTLIHDGRRSGLEVRPPCLRDGDWECTVEETGDPARPALRVGWRFVHGIGDRSLEKLRAARADGPFGAIADVVARARLTRAEALFLAVAGTFAAWEPNRHRAGWEALRVVGDALPLAPAHRTVHEPPALDVADTIFLDYATTGLSLAGHPMQAARARLARGGAVSSRDLESLPDGRIVTVGGLVTIRQRPSTAKGTVFLLLEDEWGFVNVVVHRTLVEANAEVVRHATFILVRGRLEKEGAAISVIGQRFRELEVGPMVYRSRDFR